MASVGQQPPQPQVPPPTTGVEEPLPPLDPELGVLALEWAPDLAEMLRRYDDEWDRDMIEFAFSYWSGKIEKAKARQGDRIGCRMNGLLKAPDDGKSIWEVATVLRTQSKSRNIYFLLLRFDDDKVFQEVVAKNSDLQQAEGGVWIGFNKSRRDSYIILDDWFKKKKEIKAVDPRVYRQWLDTREEIEPEPKPKSRNPSGAATPLSGASMVNHHPIITFDSFKMAEEMGKQAAKIDGDTGTPASGRRKRNSVIEAEERMQMEAQHKELMRKLRQEMQKQKNDARKKRAEEKAAGGASSQSSTPKVLAATPAVSPKPLATPEAVEAASSPETPARRKRGRPPKSATSTKRKRSGTPPAGGGINGVKPEGAVEDSNLPGTPESSTSSGVQPSTPGDSDEDGRRHSRRRRGHMDAAEAYRLAACQGLVDANPYDKWAHDSAEAQQTRKEQEEVEIEQIRLERRLKSEARSAAAKARHAAAKAAAAEEEEAPVEEEAGVDDETRKAQEREIEEKKRELKEKQKEKARLKAELAAQEQRKEQERIVEQVLQMEQGKGAADSRDAASGIIRIRAKPSPANSSAVPTPSETPKASAVEPEGVGEAAEEAAKAVEESSPSEAPPTPSSVAMDEAMEEESEASVEEDEGSDYEDDIVSVGRKSRGIKRSAGEAAASKTKRRRGQQVPVGSKRRSTVSSPSRALKTEEPKSPSGLFSPTGDISTTPHVNPRKLYREKATEGFRKLFEAGDVAEGAATNGDGTKNERCRRWAAELESKLFVATGGKNGEQGWQKYLDAMKRLVPVIKGIQSKEKHRHLQALPDGGPGRLTRPVGVTGLLLRGRLSVDQLASKHCTTDWLKELIEWDDMLLEDPTSDNRVKPIQGIRGILFKECVDPSKGPIHPGKRSAMQCHMWSYALEHEMHASSSEDAASYRQAIAGLVRKLRELEANSLPAFRLLHTNKITCKDLASTAASAIIADNSAPTHHRASLPSAAASTGGSTPGGGSPRLSVSPTEASMPPRTTTAAEPDLYDDLAVDSGVPRLPTKSDLTRASLKRVASALITAEEELQESAPDFAPAPMMDEESDDDDEGSLAEEELEAGERSRDAGHSPPPVVSEGTWVAL